VFDLTPEERESAKLRNACFHQIEGACSAVSDNGIGPLNLISRQHYQNLHHGLTALLYCHGPIGSAGAGCPKDEYEPEVSTIIPRLKNAATVEELQRIESLTFVVVIIK
jgi:hypothetical protein